MTLKIGILKAGEPPQELAASFGTYPEMLRKLLGEDDYDWWVFSADAGQFPGRVDACSAYIVTGSACGVHDDAPWIARLMGFLKAAQDRAALVGICFGHQVMAEAFGGKVIRSAHGWSLGARTYEVQCPKPWLDSMEDITLPASHQDRIGTPPPSAEAFATSELEPFGMLAYEDRPAISMQLHPEFDAGFASALVERRRGKGLSDEEADQEVASLNRPLDRERAAGWIRDFLRAACG